MEDISTENIPVKLVHLPLDNNPHLKVSVLRLDKIHPLISGNKWFKLQPWLDEAKQSGKKNILSFGGAWSNHILATAAACQLFQFKSTGIIRGEKPATLSPVLQMAAGMGMELRFISRSDFAAQRIPTDTCSGDNYIIPAGGYGIKGMNGAAGILKQYNHETYSHVCCAAGTGTTTAGLYQQSYPHQQCIAVSALKNHNGLEADIRSLSGPLVKSLAVIHEFHFGGYAKYTPALLSFMNRFYEQYRIPTDIVYTGKLFFAVNALAERNFFPANSHLLVIHSGGLTGNLSLKKGTLIF